MTADKDLLGHPLYEPGDYPGMPMKEYLAVPAVSSGVIRAMADQCPAKSWYDSFLNPLRVPKELVDEDVEEEDAKRPAKIVDDETDGTVFGTIAHSIVLEGAPGKIEIIDPREYPSQKGTTPKGWTNNNIKAARAAAIADGKLPVLLGRMQSIIEASNAVRAYIDSLKAEEPGLWAVMQPGGGTSETTMLWDDDGVLCRMRPDRIALNGKVIVDLKFTKTSAEPGQFSRSQIPRMGYYTSAAHYVHGAKLLRGASKVEYVYIVCEMTPPYLTASIGLDPAWLELGEQKRAYAMRLWRKCVAENYWPGYPSRVIWTEPPPWEEARFQEKIGLDSDGVPKESAAPRASAGSGDGQPRPAPAVRLPATAADPDDPFTADEPL